MKFNYFFLFFLLLNLLNLFNCQSYSSNFAQVIDLSYYSKYNDTISGCNTTLLVKIEYLNVPTEDHIKSLTSMSSSINFIVSEQLSSNDYTLFKLTGLNQILGSTYLSLEGSNSDGSLNHTFSNVILLNCEEPPNDLNLKINFSTSIPIDRSNDEFLFEVVVSLDLTNNLNLNFEVTSVDSAFSIDTEKISNLQYILKFRVVNSTNLVDNPIIEITPIDVTSTTSTNYASFTISPTINRIKDVDISDIVFFTWDQTNEKYGYYLFNVMNDNNYVPVVGYDAINPNLNESLKHVMKTAYPISGNQSVTQFIGYFKAPVYLSYSQDVYSFLSSNENEVKVVQSAPIEPPRNSMTWNGDSSLAYGNKDGPYYFSTYYGITSEDTGNDIIPPDQYSLGTLYNWKYINDYYPYYCVETYQPNYMKFTHEIYAPKYFYHNRPGYKQLFSVSYSGYDYSEVDYGVNVSTDVDQVIDSVSPHINDISIVSQGEYGYSLRFTLESDNSLYGFAFLTINGQLVTGYNLISDSVVELLVNQSFIIDMKKAFSILICDLINNCEQGTYFPSTFSNMEYFPFPSLQLPTFNEITIFDIKQLYFKVNTINSNSNSRSNKLYLSVDTNNQYYPIYFKLSKNSKQLLQFKWNSTTNHYECQFTVPKNYLNGKLNYYLILNDREYSYSSLYSVLGNTNTTLTVQSNQIDISPPFITNLDAIPSTNFDFDGTVESFGWDIEITDQLNGFEYGEINVTSPINPIGYHFKIYPRDLLNNITYQLRIQIENSVNCTDQKYTISSIYLRDTEGYESFSSNNAISALFQVSFSENFTIYSHCIQSQYSSAKPQLTSFTIDNLPNNIYDYSVTPLSSTIKVYYSISSDYFSTSRVPTVYLEDMFGNLFIMCDKGNTYVLNQNRTDVDMSCDIYKLPYGYGYPGPLMVSIYGIVDDFQNAIGLGPWSLNTTQVIQFYSIIQTNISQPFVPFISSNSTGQYTNNGNSLVITLTGAYFGLNEQDLTVDIVNVDPNINTGTIKVKSTAREILSDSTLQYTKLLVTGTKLILEIDLTNKISNQIQLTLNINGVQSNTYSYILPESDIVSSSSTTNSGSTNSGDNSCVELNNCGGPQQGICIAHNTCTCLYGWVGITCESKPLPGVSISIDPTKPSASLTQDVDGDPLKLFSLINLYQLRELDIQGNIIERFDLLKKWDGKKLDTVSPIQYQYQQEFGNGSMIYSILSVYTAQSSFNFGDENYSINPNSIKFTVNITDYEFKSKFNTLELVMQAKLNTSKNDDICSKKSQTGANDSDLLSIQLNDKSLYCRFLKIALLDGTNKVPISHFNRNSEFNVTLNPTSGQYYYGISIPHFNNYVLVDPDFSLLLETKTLHSSDGSICSGSSSSGLSGGAIAGIVIGSVAFITVVLIIGVSLIFKKYRFSSFTMKIRKWNSNRRSRSHSYGLKNF